MLDRLKRQKRGDNLPPELLVLGRRDILRIQAPFERTEDFRDPLNVVQGACVQHVADEFGQRDRLDVKRSEEHTSELQSRLHLVCRLLLEKKKIGTEKITTQKT